MAGSIVHSFVLGFIVFEDQQRYADGGIATLFMQMGDIKGYSCKYISALLATTGSLKPGTNSTSDSAKRTSSPRVEMYDTSRDPAALGR